MDIDILVIGSGGNGQTAVMKHLRELGFKTNSLTNKDGLKHLYNPLTVKLKKVNVKLCIFVYNKSFSSVCSHFRRKWGWKQIGTLGNRSRLKKHHVSTIDKFFELVENRNRDMFSIKFQFMNWFNNKKKLKFPVYFLDFNDYNDNESKNLGIVLNKYFGEERAPVEKSLHIEVKQRNAYNELIEKYPIAYKIYEAFDHKLKDLVTKSNDVLLETKSLQDTQEGNGV